VAYSRLLDSVEYALDYTLYNDFDVTTIQPVMEHYQSDSTQFGFWMQARCHHLLGRLGFFSDYYSEEVAQHYVDALTLLDEHFSTAQPQVCILYGKTFRMMSRLISNFKDEALCKQLGKLALEYDLMANDTSAIARSYANLAKLYELIGPFEEEADTAYGFCFDGLRYAAPEHFSYEKAILYNAMGNCYRHQVKLDSALYCFKQGKTLVDSGNMFYDQICIEEGYVYWWMKDYVSGIRVLEPILQSKNPIFRVNASFGLSMCYENLGDTLTASRYFFNVKEHRQKENVETMQNTKVVPMIREYVDGMKTAENKGVMPWLFVGVSVVVALTLFLLVQRSYRKQADTQREKADRQIVEANDALKEKSLQVLVEKSKALYASKPRTAWVEILAEFQSAYPTILTQFEKNFPDLSEGERNVALLSFLGFHIKEEAVLLHLSENTVMKYRSNLNKKAGSNPILALMD
jgi:tetratricopeptide (TPR) repeat protein